MEKYIVLARLLLGLCKMCVSLILKIDRRPVISLPNGFNL